MKLWKATRLDVYKRQVLTSLDTATALVTSLENTDVKKLTLIDIATIDKR